MCVKMSSDFSSNLFGHTLMKSSRLCSSARARTYVKYERLIGGVCLLYESPSTDYFEPWQLTFLKNKFRFSSDMSSIFLNAIAAVT